MTMRIIAGQFKGRKIKTPSEKTTRPTQGILREAIFNICQNEIIHANFLDLFAGSGAMGLEALSRGALTSTFVEHNRGALNCIKENIKALEVEKQTRVLPLSAGRATKKLKEEGSLFDLIYIDPPYHVHFDLYLVQDLLKDNAVLFLETGEKYLKELPHGLEWLGSKKFGSAYVAIFTKAKT